jgi:hypothetical protein
MVVLTHFTNASTWAVAICNRRIEDLKSLSVFFGSNMHSVF